MLNIAICDDNTQILSIVKKTIEADMRRRGECAEVHTFINGRLLLETHKAAPFDIIFLDIEMPDIGGFAVAKSLRESFSNCFIIFITTHSELVYDSFDFQPFNFIQKTDSIPIEDRVREIMRKLLTHTKQNKKVNLEDKSIGKLPVFIRDIMYIESSGHYCKFFITNRETPIKQRCSIQECKEFYEQYNFVQIHRSYIVNMKYLNVIDENNNEIRLSVKKITIPLGRKYKDDVDEKYTLYLRTII